MTAIATLTLNPTIDTAYEVERIVPTHKMRAVAERHDPGGGGINVARVIDNLGGVARAYYVAGGATGDALDGLLDAYQMPRKRIRIAGDTRLSAAVYDHATGQEYRVVPKGPEVTAEECARCLEAVRRIDCGILVASGSLMPGMPDDFYAQVQDHARRQNIRVVLDTSGPALKAGLAAGGYYLVKPSQGELRQLTGRPLNTGAEVAAAAAEIVSEGLAEIVAVTMGMDGAVLAHAGGTVTLPAVPVDAKSSVGAGDSFLGGMVHALAGGRTVVEAFRYGMAAGAATVQTPGTQLCTLAEVERLYPLVARPGG